jgi:hypothetical protein
MGLVKFGIGVSKISGKIGGSVFASNRYGSYIRNWANPVNPSSNRQQAVRSTMAALVQDWKDTLTDSQRYQWEVYAANIVMKNRLGEDIYLSGFNHFVRANMAIINAELDQVNGGPGILSLPATDPSMTSAIASGAQQVSIAFNDGLDWVDEAGGAMLIYLGKPVSAGKSFFAGPWRYAGAILGDAAAAPTSPVTMATPFAVQAGQKIWTKARIVRADGRLTEYFQPSTALVG